MNLLEAIGFVLGSAVVTVAIWTARIGEDDYPPKINDEEER